MSVISAQTSFDTTITEEIKLSRESCGSLMEVQHDSSFDFIGKLGSLNHDTFLIDSNTSGSRGSHARKRNDFEDVLEGLSLPILPNITEPRHPRGNGRNEGIQELHEPLSERTDQSTQSDFNFLDFVDLSRRGSPSSQTSNPTDFALPSIDDEYRAFNDDGIHLSPVCGGTTVPLVHADEHRSYLPELSRCFEAIGHNGLSFCDPKAIVAPLDFMNSHLLDSLNYPVLDWYIFNGSTLCELLALLHSEVLSLGVEGLLGEAMEAHAKAIRQRQAARQDWLGSKPSDATESKSILSKAEKVSRAQKALGKQSEHASRTKESSYLLSVTSRGTLRIEYIPQVNVHVYHGARAPSGVLKIFSLPQTRRRTTGVLVTFTQFKGDSPIPYLSPHIETVNVVPQDSEIIQYVSCGDIQGVRRLFDANLASPLDVDPHGFSLLSVGWSARAMRISYWISLTVCDVGWLFGGIPSPSSGRNRHAKLRQVRCGSRLICYWRTRVDIHYRYGTNLDVVWAIIATYADYHSQSLPPCYYKSGAGTKRGFDQCMRMIRAALDKDCDIDASVSYDASVSNPLFEIEAWWSLSEKHRSVPEEAIEFLIGIGYDIEARNSAGCTPLLYTATSQKPQVVTCLRTLVRKGADINISDSSGRGALHCALAAPHHFDGWRTLRLTDFPQHSLQNHLFIPAYLYHTQNSTFASDYSQWQDDAIEDDELIPKTTNKWSSGSIQDPEESRQVNAVFGGCKCGFKASSDQEENQSTPNSFQKARMETCEDYAGVKHKIRNPIQTLKMRLRFKLLTLLKAGCNPNVFDKAGETPSDYAQRDGLWPQWTWALKEAGYECVGGNNHWRRINRSWILWHVTWFMMTYFCILSLTIS